MLPSNSLVSSLGLPESAEQPTFSLDRLDMAGATQSALERSPRWARGTCHGCAVAAFVAVRNRLAVAFPLTTQNAVFLCRIIAVLKSTINPKSLFLVGATGIEPVTPTMSTR